MKYIYMAITTISLTIFSYPEMFEKEKIQYYDMSAYEITITSEK